MSLEAPRTTRGVERRVITRFWEFDQGGAWVVKEKYDVAFKDVESLLDFPKSPETINEVVPYGRIQ